MKGRDWGDLESDGLRNEQDSASTIQSFGLDFGKRERRWKNAQSVTQKINDQTLCTARQGVAVERNGRFFRIQKRAGERDEE